MFILNLFQGSVTRYCNSATDMYPINLIPSRDSEKVRNVIQLHFGDAQ